MNTYSIVALVLCVLILVGVIVYGYTKDKQNKEENEAKIKALVGDINRINEFRYKMDMYQHSLINDAQKNVEALKPVYMTKKDLGEEVRTQRVNTEKLHALNNISSSSVMYSM